MGNFDGLVLAAGKSSRMQQDKAGLLLPCGTTMLQRAISQLVDAGAKNVIVNSHLPIPLDAVNAQDDGSLLGPVAGIHAALKQNRDTPLLVLPIDMPWLQQTCLQRLVETAYESRVSTYFEDQCLPLLIWQPEVLLQELEVLKLTDNAPSVWRLTKLTEAKSICHHEPKRLRNTNTPVQWQTFLSEYDAIREK